LADEPRDDAAMVISEFFTNAVRHTASEAIRCELRLNGNLLHVEVADEGRGPTGPSQRDAGVDEEDGRGLLLVNALSRAWGVRPPASGHGRIVWAVLNCERASSPG
jgi:anti-sigma regulatory factor (Ser/Thr protein kinase)